MTYDKLDRRIISALQENSSGKLRDLCGVTSIPRSTLHERLHKLMDTGVRCVPIIDWQRLGYPLNVIFIVPFDAKILQHSSINNAQHVSPNLLLLECVFRNMEELDAFKATLRYARFFPVVSVLKRGHVSV